MKKQNQHIGITILLVVNTLLFTSIVQGQVKINSFGISMGWYNPSLDYWKEISFVSGWDKKFDGSFNGGMNVQFQFVNNINLRVSADYWEQSVKQNNIQVGAIVENEKLTLRIIPVSADLIYNLSFAKVFDAVPYIGAGGKIFYLKRTFTRSPVSAQSTDEIADGRSYAGNVFVGIDKNIIGNLNAGIEFRYVFGKYIQQEKNVLGEISDRDVSIAGPNISFVINYVIDMRLFDL